MNSASSSAQHHYHHTSSLGFGQLPPTTYENSVISTPSSAQAPITVDTSSPPLGYGYQPSPAPTLNGSNGTNGGGRRGPTIKWTKEGVSTSAERRLPFVHRFRPVDLPPPVGLVQSASSVNQTQQVNSQGYNNHPKIMNKMAQMDTNPVGALQERYQSRGILPNYRVVQFEGMSHNPVFTYQVNIGDMNAVGSGNSKKQAKHSAAKAMLDKLDGRAPAMTSTTMPMENPAEAQASQVAPNGNGVDNHGINAENGNSPTNPIGCLQEYCVKCSLPMPIYDLGNTSGQPHQRNFEIVAKVGQIMTTGVGSSKKDAKREAAVTLLEKLKALGGDVAVQANGSGSAHVGKDIDEETLKQVANMKIETLTPKHSKVLQDFYKKLQDSGKGKLLALHRTSLQNPNLEYVKLLAELGHEQMFDVTYVDIEEKTSSGEEQCLVQLSTMPVAVCHGSGPDQAAANHNAARNALEYLKLMTKRSIGTNAPKDRAATPNKGSSAKKANGK